MKKLTITAAILLTSISLFAQTKPVKPKYQKVIQLTPQDYQTLTGSLSDLKAAIIYNPQMTAEQAREFQRNIDAYLVALEKRVKLDSVIVKP